MRALHRNVERVFNPDRKSTHWGKRKLKPDCLTVPELTRSVDIQLNERVSLLELIEIDNNNA